MPPQGDMSDSQSFLVKEIARVQDTCEKLERLKENLDAELATISEDNEHLETTREFMSSRSHLRASGSSTIDYMEQLKGILNNIRTEKNDLKAKLVDIKLSTAALQEHMKNVSALLQEAHTVLVCPACEKGRTSSATTFTTDAEVSFIDWIVTKVVQVTTSAVDALLNGVLNAPWNNAASSHRIPVPNVLSLVIHTKAVPYLGLCQLTNHQRTATHSTAQASYAKRTRLCDAIAGRMKA
ncbi:hypothetical protein BKA62DRAFT_671757 [Auriculariales sp. MPI-PUGE-AT-0066]|nr:hypothetical protein BKA62DRAFT_671757 [Auriculariales sp. MPI-PUGE-AT-0066]